MCDFYRPPTRVEEVSALGHETGAVEHVHTTEEKMMGVDQVIIDLRVLACVCVHAACEGAFKYTPNL